MKKTLQLFIFSLYFFYYLTAGGFIFNSMLGSIAQANADADIDKSGSGEIRQIELRFLVDDTKVDLFWNPVYGADKYELKYCYTSSPSLVRKHKKCGKKSILNAERISVFVSTGVYFVTLHAHSSENVEIARSQITKIDVHSDKSSNQNNNKYGFFWYPLFLKIF